MAGTRAQAPLRFRTRKLVPKQPLPVIREDEIQSDEYKELLETTETIATGVEQSEESEYHLQQVLEAIKGKKSPDAQKIVPAPPAVETAAINYDEAYSAKFPQPHSYIRFSSTIEECTGCQYDTNSEDDAWLKAYNSKRPASSQCSEDCFERLMEFFEFTAELQTPYASVDNTVVSFETMQLTIRTEIDEKGRTFAKDIYEHWKTQRLSSSNRSLQPSLKFEIHQEADDSDPYVCFRRRDVRQTRKTRNRDVQSTDKLKKLRKELEDGRLLVYEALAYQKLKSASINVDRRLFEQRAKVRDLRHSLQIRHEDDDLYHKPPKKKPTENSTTPRAQGQIRPPLQPNGRPIESELLQLSDQLKEKETLLQKFVEDKIAQHYKFNVGHIDVTREPLSEDRHPNTEPSFRTAHTQYLMTPPASIDGSQDENESLPQPDFALAKFSSAESAYTTQPSYRRRIGRCGRMWIDRRGMKSTTSENVSQDVLDRWKYDSDDEDEPTMYEIDPYDTRALKYRATIPSPNSLRQANSQTNSQSNHNGALATRPSVAAANHPSQTTQPT